MAKGARILKKGFESDSLSDGTDIDSIHFMDDDNGATDAYFGGAEPNIQWIQLFKEMGWWSDQPITDDTIAATDETTTTADEPEQPVEPNTAPDVEITHLFALTGPMSPVGKWVAYSDADGDAATQYQFWDSGLAPDSAYLVTPSNPHHSAGAVITVGPNELGDVWVRGGELGTGDTMWVRASDGTDWSEWEPVYFATVLLSAGSMTMSMPIGGLDILIGLAGEDTLDGGTGNDFLDDGAGDEDSDLSEDVIQLQTAAPITGGFVSGYGSVHATAHPIAVTPGIVATVVEDSDILLV